jgi:hypothetical protein
MAWTTPKTWASGYVVLAADLNTHLRDNLNVTAPAVMTTAGDIIYASGANTPARLAKSTTSTQYLANTGGSNIPQWNEVALTTGVSGVLPVANGGTGGTLPVSNGGTGGTSLTANGILVGNSTSAVAVTATMATKGHLMVGDGSGVPSMLSVGTNNYVLTADSGEGTGVKWAAGGDAVVTTLAKFVEANPTSRATIVTPGSGKKVRVHSVMTAQAGDTTTLSNWYFGSGASEVTDTTKAIAIFVSDLQDAASNNISWGTSGPLGAADEVVSIKNGASVTVNWLIVYSEE